MTKKQNALGATKASFETNLSLNCNAHFPHSKPFMGVL
jgi:hypothetical protein